MLPHSLVHNKGQPQKREQASAQEILFAAAPRTGLYFLQQLLASHTNMRDYVSALQRQLTLLINVFYFLPDPDSVEGAHSLQPGDWMVLNRHMRWKMEPRFDGPYQVQLTMQASVKLEGK